MPGQWRELDEEQRRIVIDATELYRYRLDLVEQLRELRGGLYWKTVKGKQYLVRGLDRYGHVRSLGTRSPETEALHHEFVKNKRELKTRIAGAGSELEKKARFCIAAGVNRVPVLPANIIRVLDRAGLLGVNLMIVGSHALYAYEAAAGVQLKSGLLQTEDLDTLLTGNLEFAGSVKTSGLLGLLRSVDKTFSPLRNNSFRAANARGFMVDLLRSPASGLASGLPTIGWGKDLVAEPIEGLEWIAGAPTTRAIAIAGDGFPLRLVVPDARVFALHKIWMSLRAERGPIKRKRDFRHGEAVAQLAVQYLNLSFEDPVLRSLPPELATVIPGLLDRIRSRRNRSKGLPPGL
jgi:hypothetical protein